LLAYLLFWPTAVTPIAWHAPENAGYIADFAPNKQLAMVDIAHAERIIGAEDIAMDTAGRLYFSTHNGEILRLPHWQGTVEVFAKTGGRPLGMEFSAS